MAGEAVKKVLIKVGLEDEASAKLSANFKKVESSSKIALGTISALGATLGALITKSTLTAARTETLGVAMEAVAKATGTSIAVLKEQEAALDKQGITIQEARRTLTKFMQSELDVAQATDLARVAQDLAVISGENSSQTVGRLTDAIANMNPELLKEVGIVKNLDEVFRGYAKQIGKNVGELTELDKKQAMVNLILEEGTKVAGTYEAAMETAGKKLGSLSRWIEKAANAIGEKFLEPFNDMIDLFTEFLKKVTPEAVDRVFKSLNEWLPVIAGVILGMVTPALIGMAISLWGVLRPLLPFIAAGAALGLVLQALGIDFGDIKEAIERFTGAVKDSWERVSKEFDPAISHIKTTWKTETEPALQEMRDSFIALYESIGGDASVIEGLDTLEEIMGTAVVGWMFLFTEGVKKLAEWASILADNIKLAIDNLKEYKREAEENALPTWQKGGIGTGGKPFATGGVTSGGLTMVGERGAELVSLPRGSHVYNSEDTKQMVGGGGITINVNAPVTGVDNLKATILEAVNEATARQNRLANYNLL
jgi:chemotaxis regulatin CheY-phosphate phosphatase CheZ